MRQLQLFNHVQLYDKVQEITYKHFISHGYSKNTHYFTILIKKIKALLYVQRVLVFPIFTFIYLHRF